MNQNIPLRQSQRSMPRHTEDIDLMKYLYLFLANLKWFALAVFLSVGTAYFINKHSARVYSGNSADIEIQANELLKTKELSAQILAKNCKQPVEKILKDFNRDYYMDARESVAYGIADAVLENLVEER
jgi:hypothetical protein